LTSVTSSPAERPPLRRPLTLTAVWIVASLVTLPQLFIVVWLIPETTRIYGDLLADRPLPWITSAVIGARWYFVAFAFLWSLGCWLLVRRRGSMRGLMPWMFLATVPIVVTTVGLVFPLIGPATRMR
jgi:hypothetical protein